jgi:hypothetical protein
MRYLQSQHLYDWAPGLCFLELHRWFWAIPLVRQHLLKLYVRPLDPPHPLVSLIEIKTFGDMYICTEYA